MGSVKRTMKRGQVQRPLRIAAHTHLHPAPRPRWGEGWYSLVSEETRQQAETVPIGYGYALQRAGAAGPEHAEARQPPLHRDRDQPMRRESTVDVTRSHQPNKRKTGALLSQRTPISRPRKTGRGCSPPAHDLCPGQYTQRASDFVHHWWYTIHGPPGDITGCLPQRRTFMVHWGFGG